MAIPPFKQFTKQLKQSRENLRATDITSETPENQPEIESNFTLLLSPKNKFRPDPKSYSCFNASIVHGISDMLNNSVSTDDP